MNTSEITQFIDDIAQECARALRSLDATERTDALSAMHDAYAGQGVDTSDHDDPASASEYALQTLRKDPTFRANELHASWVNGNRSSAIDALATERAAVVRGFAELLVSHSDRASESVATALILALHEDR